MSSSAAVGRVFGAASVALFGVAAYLAYGTQTSKHTQLVVQPARPLVPPAPVSAEGGGGSSSISSSSTGASAFPIVLPPRTAAAQAAALSDSFAQQCAEAAVHGLPSTAEVRCYGGYLASLNYERRIPNWVMEVVDYRRLRAGRRPTSASGGDEDGTSGGEGEEDGSEVSRKGSNFYADDTVPAAFRVGPDSYTARGMSRGHLAPAQLHKASQAEMDSTFNMNANIVPQDMTLNAVDWLRLEGLTRKLSKEVGDGKHSQAGGAGGRVYVVTGPAFVPRLVRVERRPDGAEVHVPLSPADPSAAPRKAGAAAASPVKTVLTYELTGDATRGNLVAVPSHMFKVFLAEEDGGRSHSAAAFMMPNGPITEQLPLTAYQVPIDRLQRITGLQFFPGMDATRLPDLCKSHKCDARPSALFQRYRQVAQLRAADSVPRLRQTYAALQAAAAGGKLDDAVQREFEKRTEELVAEAVGPLDRAERR
ncbi:endonuclease G [Novymonas esmeraldas]|uniref:Endonuclease G n=1 Tax=Novymonas esmeraldas TaxID=1808958 RepID=A0AAW0ELN1_9TRYP